MDKKYLEKKLVNLSNLDLYRVKHLISYIYLSYYKYTFNIEVALTSQKPTELII